VKNCPYWEILFCFSLQS